VNPLSAFKRKIKRSISPNKPKPKGLSTAGGFKKSLKLRGRAKGMSFGKMKGY
jgi:hypothetical protein